MYGAYPQCTTDPRRLYSDDRAAILQHLLRLSDQDRQMRFYRVLSDESVAAYVELIDFEKDVCFGIFGGANALIALAQGFPYNETGTQTIEAAFSTDEVWRRRGLGTLLFVEVTEYACDNGIDRVIAQCLARNRPMRALLRAVGVSCEVEDGEVIGELKLV